MQNRQFFFSLLAKEMSITTLLCPFGILMNFGLLCMKFILSHQPTTVKQIMCFYLPNKVEQKRFISFPHQSPILGTRCKTVLLPQFSRCSFDDVPDGDNWIIHVNWGVWRILPRKSGIYRACPFGRFWHGKSPQTPKCRRLQAPWSMERLNEKDATAFSAVFNHFHIKFFASTLIWLKVHFFWTDYSTNDFELQVL